MSDRDDPIARRYRDLPREEPPSALDASILAASRGALRRPRQRWAGPLSIAAVLVLAVGITLRMQHEEPGIETSAPVREAPIPPRKAVEAPAPAARPAPEQRRTPAAKPPSAKRAPAARDEAPVPIEPPAAAEERAPLPSLPAARPFAPPPPPGPPAAAAGAPAAAPSAPASQSNAMPARASPAMQKRARDAQGAVADVGNPEAELERIAALREAGRDSEADQALEAFRRRHPDYRIPEAVWSRVKPR